MGSVWEFARGRSCIGVLATSVLAAVAGAAPAEAVTLGTTFSLKFEGAVVDDNEYGGDAVRWTAEFAFNTAVLPAVAGTGPYGTAGLGGSQSSWGAFDTLGNASYQVFNAAGDTLVDVQGETGAILRNAAPGDPSFNDYVQLDVICLKGRTRCEVDYAKDPSLDSAGFLRLRFFAGSADAIASDAISALLGSDFDDLTAENDKPGPAFANSAFFVANPDGAGGFRGTYGTVAASVPEIPLPAGMVLLLSALGGLWLARRRDVPAA